MKTGSRYTHLECHKCGTSYDKAVKNTYCPKCEKPLLARYNMDVGLDKSMLSGRNNDMWRYKEMLPIEESENIVTLGEGGTPLLELNNFAQDHGFQSLKLKNESLSPTGSFKARGLCMAVSKAKELGLNEFCIPTAGNAGSALSAYTAKMKGIAHIFMPELTPTVFQMDCEIMGAQVTKVKGSIKDAGAAMKQENQDAKWWDVTTLKEPFRLEGKKTMGYEIAEQLDWQLPDVILYPTGGGTGLIGIWKAFLEMKALGWVESIPTKMVAVQTEGCNPIVTAFQKGDRTAPLYENPAVTIANGLRVPKAFGDELILDTIYDSGGCAVDVSESDMKEWMRAFAEAEGIFLSPEGAAVVSAAVRLRKENFIEDGHSVVLLNTGSPYKYIENL